MIKKVLSAPPGKGRIFTGLVVSGQLCKCHKVQQLLWVGVVEEPTGDLKQREMMDRALKWVSVEGGG